MEKQQNVDVSREQEHTVVESINQSQQTKSLDDLMYQRMKNRERQRRYRERKRLQADINKSTKMNELTPLPLPPPPPSTAIISYQHVTRVHCTRDWKKDARRAHAVKQENANAFSCHTQTSAHGNQVSCLVAGVKALSEKKPKDEISTHPSALEDSEKLESKSIRRSWKAEARSKKGETK